MSNENEDIVEKTVSKAKQMQDATKKTAKMVKGTGGAVGKTFGITSKILGTAGKIVGTVVSEVAEGVSTVDGFVRQGYHVLKNGANTPTDKEKEDIHKYIEKFPEYIEWALEDHKQNSEELTNSKNTSSNIEEN